MKSDLSTSLRCQLHLLVIENEIGVSCTVTQIYFLIECVSVGENASFFHLVPLRYSFFFILFYFLYAWTYMDKCVFVNMYLSACMCLYVCLCISVCVCVYE